MKLSSYTEDESLTTKQQSLKFSLYCECELEDINDTIAVLKSLLKDAEKEGGQFA